MPKKAAKETAPEEEVEILEVEEKMDIDKIMSDFEEQKNLLLRTAAEFDNFKKRTEREREALSEFVAGQTIKALIPAIDNLMRATEADKNSIEYAKGVEMTIKGLMDALTGLGLQEINPKNETFDPQYHSAVKHIEDESLADNIVSEVYQKGYKLKDIVLRHAMVEVAN